MKGMIAIRPSYFAKVSARNDLFPLPTGTERKEAGRLSNTEGVEPSEKQNRH